jgi:hypothetical protein
MELTMASKRVVYDVEPRDSGRWAAQRSGSSRAASVSDSKADAIAEARRLAQQYPLSQVRIRNADGRVEREYTYGQDPERTKG